MSDMNGTKALAIEEHLKKIGNGYIRFDCRGHGESGGEFPNFGINDWAEDASLVITELTNDPVVLIGSSMGGWSMLLTAINHPEKVLGLIGIAAAPDFTEDILCKLNKENLKLLSLNGFVEIPSEYDESPYIISKILMDSGKNNLLLNHEISITCPVHLFHGSNDEDVPFETSLKLMKNLKSDDVQLTLVKNSNHQFSTDSDLKLIITSINKMLSLDQ
jgi:pimeloyl-ACP methyl ester carboxylesterase